MATTNPIAKFIQGSDELDFTTGNLSIKTGTFTPPEYGLRPNISSLTLINIVDDSPRRLPFEIVIQVDTEQEGRFEGRRIADFLRRSGNPDNPLYLAYKPNSDVDFEPSTGQIGASIFYPVIHGFANVGGLYSESDMKTKGWFLPVNLTIHPYALGLPEIFWSATGGIILDQKEGRPNGFIVPEATTNKMTNPGFSHDIYDNGWTKASSTVYQKTIDPNHIRYGISSISIAAVAATNNTLTQSINVGNTNIHTMSARVRLIDGGTVSSTYCQLYYDSAQTTVFTQDPTDSDWWILETQGITGIASAKATGLVIKNGYGIIVDFVQIEEKAFRTPWCAGSMLGCTWSTVSTAGQHNSTSVRTVGRIREATDDMLNIEQGTIFMAVRMAYANDDGPFAAADCTFFADSTADTKFFIEWDLSTTDWRMGDGTNQAQGASDTWPTGDIKVLVGTWSTANGLKLFVGDTTSLDTDTPYATAAYTAVAFQTNGYIGSDSTPAAHHNSTFLAFGIFDRELTPTQIQNIYANVRPQLASGEAVNDIPWRWTSIGNDVTVNHDDADSGDDNYVVVGGVPGGLAAEAYFAGTASVGWNVFDRISVAYLSAFTTDSVPLPVLFNVFDSADTVAAGNSSGGYLETSVSTSAQDIFLAQERVADMMASAFFRGKTARVYVRLYDSGSNLQVRFYLSDGGGLNTYSKWRAISSTTAFEWFSCEPLGVAGVETFIMDHADRPENIRWAMEAKRTSGTANMRMDFAIMLPESDIAVLTDPSTDTGVKGFILKGRQARTYSVATEILPRVPLQVFGGPIELEPQVPAYVWFLMGSPDATQVISHALTHTVTSVVPRWPLI